MGASLCGAAVQAPASQWAPPREETTASVAAATTAGTVTAAVLSAEEERQYEEVRRLCEERERHLEARDKLDCLLSGLGVEQRLVVEKRELVRRLRHKCELIDRFIAELNTDDWQLTSASSHTHKRELLVKKKSGAATMRVRGRLEEPLLNVAAMVNEVDLHPLFVPFMAKAERLHSVKGCGDHGQVVARMEYHLPPPLRTRELLLFGFFCDALGDPRIDGLLLIAQSLVPSQQSASSSPAETAGQFWGYALPPAAPKTVHMELELMGFILRPLSADGGRRSGADLVSRCQSELDLVLRCDMKLGPLVPWSMVNYVGQHVVKKTFDNIETLSRDFHNTPYPERIAQDPAFYTQFIQNTVLLLDRHRRPTAAAATAAFVSCVDEAEEMLSLYSAADDGDC